MNWLEEKDLSFSWALAAMKKGKKVARAHWGGYWFIPKTATVVDCTKENHHLVDLNPMIVACLKDGGGYCPATPYQEDLLAEDWRVVE